METILITGASGLIGRSLKPILEQKGFTVKTLTTRKSSCNDSTFYWNIENQYIDIKSLENVNHIINLAGINIGEKRWTKTQKKNILDSRVLSAKLLFDTIKTLEHKPQTFISASAVGYYGGISSDHIFSEKDKPGNDFLGTVCQQWETSALQFEQLGIRVVTIRTGVVLAKNGGAFEKMMKPFTYGLGSIIGTGRQYLPWIHINDICGIYLWTIENTSFKGTINAVAPQYINNKEFSIQLSKALRKPMFLPPIPSILLKCILGEMSLLIIYGSRISSQRIIEKGYIFQYPTLQLVLNNLFT